jgi:hypothetical protein
MVIALVSHDAGGAEILASYVRKHALDCAFALDGPARSVFERKLGAVRVTTVEDAIARARWLLCGTSWQSDIEWHAIGLSREAGKRSVAFIDHWSNFRDRFVRLGKVQLPDEIWVGDDIAEQLAQKCFPGTLIKLVPNPYFEELRQEIAGKQVRQPHSGGLDALFVSEPLQEHGQREFGNELHWGYTEFDALRYFLSNIDLLGVPVRKVVVRPHPSEPADKYDWVSSEYGSTVVPGGKRTLHEEIADCDLVVGCESMAMVVGLVAGRRVVCCIPPGGRPCALPQPEIESLQRMAAAAGREHAK